MHFNPQYYTVSLMVMSQTMHKDMKYEVLYLTWIVTQSVLTTVLSTTARPFIVKFHVEKP